MTKCICGELAIPELYVHSHAIAWRQGLIRQILPCVPLCVNCFGCAEHVSRKRLPRAAILHNLVFHRFGVAATITVQYWVEDAASLCAYGSQMLEQRLVCSELRMRKDFLQAFVQNKPAIFEQKWGCPPASVPAAECIAAAIDRGLSTVSAAFEMLFKFGDFSDIAYPRLYDLLCGRVLAGDIVAMRQAARLCASWLMSLLEICCDPAHKLPGPTAAYADIARWLCERLYASPVPWNVQARLATFHIRASIAGRTDVAIAIKDVMQKHNTPIPA